MPRSVLFSLVLATAALLPPSTPSFGSDPCGTSSTITAAPAKFYAYRPGEFNSLTRRDLEFMWDSLYLTDPNFDPDTRTTLLSLANSLILVQGRNPLGVNLPDFRLAYDYFRRSPQSSFYTTDPFDSMSVRLGNSRGVAQSGEPGTIAPYNRLDRSHVDCYLKAPGRGGPAIYPSDFASGDEDLSTGHSSADIKHANSIGIGGPQLSLKYDLEGTGWTHPDSDAVLFFIHEFQHSLPNATNEGSLPPMMDELMSSGAEVLTGRVIHGPEVPYTWSLATQTVTSGNCPPFDYTFTNNNYPAWKMFTAYLAYKFRGADTSATASGLLDDLLRKWARAPFVDFAALGSLLTNDSCFDCSGPALNPSGPALSGRERLRFLIHNWRVANFVNDVFLANGQYGYPPHLGFSPGTSIRAWQPVDACDEDDIVAVPPIITLGAAQRLRDTLLAGVRSFRGSTHPLSLQPLGAEYFVFKSDAALTGTTQDLILTVQPATLFNCPHGPPGKNDGRLVATVVGYTAQDTATQVTTLWKRPDWASLVVGPQWADLDSVASPLRLVIPGFGTTYKAALLILTLEPGPTFSWPVASGWGYFEGVRFHVSAGLRRAYYSGADPNPFQLTPVGSLDQSPCWAPSNDELAYIHIEDNQPAQIYRRRLNGSPPFIMAANDTANQNRPDWSPRGDLIAYEQETGWPKSSEVWVFNTVDGSKRRLAPASILSALRPAFSPNGQQVAYVRLGESAPHIRRIDVSGSNDMAIATGFSLGNITDLRWSSDGNWIYFARNDSLYVVSANGGSPIPRSTSTNLWPAGFDFPLSGSAVLVDAVMPSHPTCPGDGPTLRLIQRADTVRAAAHGVFPRPSNHFSTPRYSFDQSMAAYTVETEGQFNPRIEIGPLGFNRAPVFQDLGDRSVTVGNVLTIYLSATDPDGEVISFTDVQRYRPPGATFNAQGHFQWQNAGPVGAQYYVVFRAHDQSGGVANRVVLITVTNDPANGCPFLDTWTAAGWQVENSILSRSVVGALERDVYRLKTTPVVIDGRYHLRVRENEREIARLDRVSLVSVDHPIETRVYPLRDQFVLAQREAPYRAVTSAGQDVTHLLNGSRAGFFIGEPGEFLDVDLIEPGRTVEPVPPDLDPFEIDDGDKGGGGGGLSAGNLEATGTTLDAQVLASTGILIQGKNAFGQWETVRRRYPREHFDAALIDTLDEGPVRLVFVGRHKLRYVGRVVPTSLASPQVHRLAQARHTRLGDAQGAVTSGDNQTVTLGLGDTLNLEFVATPVPQGQERDFFLVSHGVYTTLPLSPETQTVELPRKFALLQNRPNPFARSTLIDFELPRAERVRIDIFDAQGRLVRTVADQLYQPGQWSVEWDGRDEAGALMPATLYFYRMTTGDFRTQKKLVLLP